MSIDDFGNLEDNIGLAPSEGRNAEPRCPVVLLLDCSYSMSGQRIEQLNAGVKTFKDSLCEDRLASQRVEIAIITFGSDVKVVQDFVTVDNFSPQDLVASGLTPMGAAIRKGIELTQVRKTHYKNDLKVPYFRPWIFVFTDGQPTDTWDDLPSQICADEKAKKYSFFAVGVDEANMQILNEIAPPSRQAVFMKSVNFHEYFVWLSNSMSVISQSIPGEAVSLPPITGWATVET